MKSPRTIKTHLPGHLLPPDVMNKKSRIVYVARNPKDVTVSVYHFHQMNAALPKYVSWDDFFNDFISGNTIFGQWWDHYLYYWNKRHLPNVLFIKFEDMKRDLRDVIEQVSDFLGYSLTKNQIDAIFHHCSFDNMKSNPMVNPDFMFNSSYKQTLRDDRPTTVPAEDIQAEEISTAKYSFMRKGKVGDWKNHFTVAQNEVMDAQILDKLAGSGLTFEF
ncbi:sulfotransferase 1C4-like [Amphiura filiformis]|uniref:sulfotransferase 1C4-like n=1 Tax=Amphiura filiformis TaxID=82378 RepID=UPI003B214C31